MAEPTTGTPPITPPAPGTAPAPATPATPVKPTDAAAPAKDGAVTRLTADHDSALVTIKIDGQDRQIPLSKLRDQAQKSAAADKRFAQAAELRNKNAAAVQAYERNQRLMTENPGGAVHLAEQEAMRHGWTPPKANQPTAPAPDPLETDFDTERRTVQTDDATNAEVAALKQTVDELKREMGVVTQDRLMESTKREITHSLEGFALFQGTTPAHDDVRDMATTVLAGLRASNPDVDMGDAAQYVHDKFATILSAKATEDLTTRRERVIEHASISPAEGSPALTHQGPPITYEGAKKGELRTAIEAMAERFKDSMNVSAR